ncbi:MAG: hypothetical protein P4L73_13500 [Caulobacteraceae bacterium]|nr:hypothetical protein [Caulobacteraceae bacterium]
MSEVMQDIVFTFRITGLATFGLRCRIAGLLFRIGAAVLGARSEVTIDTTGG